MPGATNTLKATTAKNSSRWFAAAGMAEPDGAPMLRFSEESHVIQAAVAGKGVALVSLPLVKNELEAGQLVQPFGPAIPGFRHHLLRHEGETNAATTAVARWLLSEAAAAVQDGVRLSIATTIRTYKTGLILPVASSSPTQGDTGELGGHAKAQGEAGPQGRAVADI